MRIKICKNVAVDSNDNQDISVFVSGDVYPDAKASNAILEDNGRKTFGKLCHIIDECDLSVLNLETPATLARKRILKYGPHLKIQPKTIQAFKKIGFNVASLANNHIGDYDSNGVIDTVNCLNQTQIKWFGVGENIPKASLPCIIRKKGQRIALLGFAENEFTIAGKNHWGAAGLSPAENVEIISNTAKQNDAVLVFIHGGNEFNPFPSPRMIKLYRAFVRAGASAVIGTHPHVPQGFEIYLGSPIFYSLGNLLFPKNSDIPFWNYGFAVKLYLYKKNVTQFEVIPVVQTPGQSSVDEMDLQEKTKFLKYLKTLSQPISSQQKIENLWSGWCAMHGPTWLQYFTELSLPVSEKQRNVLTLMKNLIRCEAHNELVVTYLEMVRHKRLKEAEKYIPEIQKLMRGYEI
jgi:poly-gamma-glutamate synthesis protein (capsule biosynthesis protein)